jgi:hypothetical protein
MLTNPKYHLNLILLGFKYLPPAVGYPLSTYYWAYVKGKVRFVKLKTDLPYPPYFTSIDGKRFRDEEEAYNNLLESLSQYQ